MARDKYYKKFKVVEIQQTFYQPPEIEIIDRWRRSAPDDFEFTLKAWQLITHQSSSPTYRRLKIKLTEKERLKCGFFNPSDKIFEAWDRIDATAAHLKAKIIVFQCPASFKPDEKNIDNLKRFFKRINRKDFKFVWEPRGKWPEPVIKRLCKDLNLIHCVDPFKDKAVYGDIGYFRLHGIGGYRYKYSDSDLKRLKNFCIGKKVIYVMFNNTNMWEDAIRFKGLW